MVESLERLLGAIYEAPLAAKGWDALGLELERAFAARAGAFVIALPNGNAYTSTTWGMPPDIAQSYGAYYNALDPYLARAISLPGPATFTQVACHPRAVHRSSEFYNDYEKRVGEMDGDWQGGVLLKDGAGIVGLGLYRSKRQDEFGAADQRLLGIIAPHLNRAARIFRHIGHVEARRDLSQALLDRVDVAVLLVDASARVVETNVAAKRLIALRDGLSLDRASLCGAAALETRALQKLIHDAATGRGSGEMLLPRPSGLRPFVAIVSPLRDTGTPQLGLGPLAMVLVSDLDRSASGTEDTLRRLFGLTPAEARVAALVGENLVPKEIAVRLGVRFETVRTQLKHTFQKVGVTRQAELARLVTRLAALRAAP